MTREAAISPEAATGERAPLDLVLASTSPYRRALLGRLGVPFRCLPPQFDETSVAIESVAPRVLAETLARRKAESIAAIEPGAVVIGCDQLVSLEGRILGKPGTVPRAIEQLELMAGRSHDLITALVVIGRGKAIDHTDLTRMKMRPLCRPEIERYVFQDQPVDCAGSYKLEERGIVLFERIETEDPTAITGLPLIRLTEILRWLGFKIP
jgi:septum formation protein